MTRAALAALMASIALAASLSAQMPPIRQMSGRPLPVADLTVGTVTVRVVRGALTNPIVDQPVVLTGAGAPITANTNAAGRAEFTGLTPGSRVTAETSVDGETLTSQTFEVPAAGGIRLMLVATDPVGAVREPPLRLAQPGTVVLGEETRFVFEIGDDGINVFNIVQIVNPSNAPVTPPVPMVFDLPDYAEHASLMEGSTPQAVVAGKRVTVSGPFAPGPTVLQFAYTIEFGRGTLVFEQKLPADLRQLTVIAQKIGALSVTSSQFAQQRDMETDGQVYLLARGPALEAGDTLTLNFTGLPHHPTWPRNVALAFAAAILIAGAWGSVRAARSAPSGAAARLQAKRDRLFDELTDVEAQYRAGAIDDAPYQRRRRELIEALERVYAQLDEAAA